MIKTKNLCFKNLIKYNDVHIEQGKINFIVGESGCGKTTLLKLFNKTEDDFSGEIIYKEKPIQSYESIALRKELKLISQTAFLFPGTILNNFKLFFNYCDEKLLTEDEMLYYLRLCEANFSLNDICDTLSGGEKQRVFIAICFSLQSEVIMLDEPTSAMDFSLSCKVLENIITFAKTNDKTLIIISHDKTLLNRYAENIINLSEVKANE